MNTLRKTHRKNT